MVICVTKMGTLCKPMQSMRRFYDTVLTFDMSAHAHSPDLLKQESKHGGSCFLKRYVINVLRRDAVVCFWYILKMRKLSFLCILTDVFCLLKTFGISLKCLATVMSNYNGSISSGLLGIRHSRGVLTKYSSAGQTVSAAASVSSPQLQPNDAAGEYSGYAKTPGSPEL